MVGSLLTSDGGALWVNDWIFGKVGKIVILCHGRDSVQNRHVREDV